MSNQILFPETDSNSVINLDTIYSTLEELIDFSNDEPTLEPVDALQYLKDVALKCEN